jgi:hypothetical protein
VTKPVSLKALEAEVRALVAPRVLSNDAESC